MLKRSVLLYWNKVFYRVGTKCFATSVRDVSTIDGIVSYTDTKQPVQAIGPTYFCIGNYN